MIEFALVIPVFMLLAVVIFDLGRAIYYYSTIHNAAREERDMESSTPMIFLIWRLR